MAFIFTDKNFEESSKSGVSVIDFWAEWCGPCKAIGPMVEEVASEYGDTVRVGKMDVDSNMKVPQDFGVRGIPTIAILRNGVLVDKHVGSNITKFQLKEKIDAALALA